MRVALAAFVTLALMVAAFGGLAQRVNPDEWDRWWEPYVAVAFLVGVILAFFGVGFGMFALWAWAL